MKCLARKLWLANLLWQEFAAIFVAEISCKWHSHVVWSFDSYNLKTMRTFRVITFVVEKHILCVCSLIYQACEQLDPYFVVNYGLPVSKIFSKLYHKRNDFRGKCLLYIKRVFWFWFVLICFQYKTCGLILICFEYKTCVLILICIDFL